MSDYLPQELVVEIFTKLPVKSLLRFRCLSKSWRSLIASPDFIRMHTLGLVKTTQKVLIRNNIISGKDIYSLHQEDQLPLSSRGGYQGITAVEFPSCDYQIIGSCNGILCLLDYYMGISLWNYSVRRQLTIPEHPFQSESSGVAMGFGFDPITNDYKILTIYYGATLGLFLYTVNTASWSAVAPLTTRLYDVESESCFVNGALHWVVKCDSPESPDIRHRVIMTFDLSTHVFGTILLPEPSWETKQLAVINDSLAVICTKGYDDTWIWVRRESNHVASWSVFLKLETPEFEVGPVLQPTSNGDLLIYTYTDGDENVYNPRTGVLSTLLEFRCSCYIEMKTYVESLELLDRGTPYGKAIKWTKKRKHE